jgi:hypothetical protein
MRTLLATLALSLCCATPAIAQGQSAIEMGQQHVLRSRVMNENREILVIVPDSYARTTIGYPVLFVLDGRSHILHATATSGTQPRSGNDRRGRPQHQWQSESRSNPGLRRQAARPLPPIQRLQPTSRRARIPAVH